MKRLIILIMITGLPSAIQAQEVGIGGMVNNLSNGILLSYSPKWNKNWNIDLGLRVNSRISFIGNNEQGVTYYQQGYPKSLPEYLGLNFRLNRRIFTFHFVEVGFMTNLFINWEGIRNDDGPYRFYNYATGQWLEGEHNITYYKPSPAAELTIGPALRINFSAKVSFYGTVGYGVIYMHHSRTGWSETFNKPSGVIFTGTPDWERGNFELVGAEGLPMISFGVKYKLK